MKNRTKRQPMAELSAKYPLKLSTAVVREFQALYLAYFGRRISSDRALVLCLEHLMCRSRTRAFARLKAASPGKTIAAVIRAEGAAANPGKSTPTDYNKHRWGHVRGRQKESEHD